MKLPIPLATPNCPPSTAPTTSGQATEQLAEQLAGQLRMQPAEQSSICLPIDTSWQHISDVFAAMFRHQTIEHHSGQATLQLPVSVANFFQLAKQPLADNQPLPPMALELANQIVPYAHLYGLQPILLAAAAQHYQALLAGHTTFEQLLECYPYEDQANVFIHYYCQQQYQQQAGLLPDQDDTLKLAIQQHLLPRCYHLCLQAKAQAAPCQPILDTYAALYCALQLSVTPQLLGAPLRANEPHADQLYFAHCLLHSSSPSPLANSTRATINQDLRTMLVQQQLTRAQSYMPQVGALLTWQALQSCWQLLTGKLQPAGLTWDWLSHCYPQLPSAEQTQLLAHLPPDSPLLLSHACQTPWQAMAIALPTSAQQALVGQSLSLLATSPAYLPLLLWLERQPNLPLTAEQLGEIWQHCQTVYLTKQEPSLKQTSYRLLAALCHHCTLEQLQLLLHAMGSQHAQGIDLRHLQQLHGSLLARAEQIKGPQVLVGLEQFSNISRHLPRKVYYWQRQAIWRTHNMPHVELPGQALAQLLAELDKQDGDCLSFQTCLYVLPDLMLHFNRQQHTQLQETLSNWLLQFPLPEPLAYDLSAGLVDYSQEQLLEVSTEQGWSNRQQPGVVALYAILPLVEQALPLWDRQQQRSWLYFIRHAIQPNNEVLDFNASNEQERLEYIYLLKQHLLRAVLPYLGPVLAPQARFALQELPIALKDSFIQPLLLAHIEQLPANQSTQSYLTAVLTGLPNELFNHAHPTALTAMQHGLLNLLHTMLPKITSPGQRALAMELLWRTQTTPTEETLLLPAAIHTMYALAKHWQTHELSALNQLLPLLQASQRRATANLLQTSFLLGQEQIDWQTLQTFLPQANEQLPAMVQFSWLTLLLLCNLRHPEQAQWTELLYRQWRRQPPPAVADSHLTYLCKRLGQVLPPQRKLALLQLLCAPA